jgi:hypothetical protein
MKSWCLEMIKECLCISSMRLGVPFIAPRQLGVVGGNQGRQFFPSVEWRTEQSGAPPDRHCSMSGADCLPKLAQPTVEDLEPLAHSPVPPSDRWLGHASRGIARPTVGSPDSPVHHRTVRWILAIHRRRIPESGQLTRRQPGAPDTVWCTTGQSGVPRLRRVLTAPAKSFSFCIFSDSST